MVIPDVLLNLAPTALPLLRSERYGGESLSIPLQDFSALDQQRLHHLYQAVHGFYEHWLSMRAAPDYADLQRWLTRKVTSLLAEAQALGSEMRTQEPADALKRKVLHDIRGGGLTAFLGTADLLRLYPAKTRLIPKCIVAARDHAKIMRNAIPDLDPPVRAADEANRTHDIADFVSKWEGMTVPHDGASVRVAVQSAYHGGISARCLETSAIDRVLYNYINNALRFASTGLVTLWIFPVGDTLIRWVVHNVLTPQHQEWLKQTTQGNLQQLYLGGLTSGGHGIGLRNCAEFVADCFGVETIQKALDRKYLGAQLIGADYYAWFHWPSYAT